MRLLQLILSNRKAIATVIVLCLFSLCYAQTTPVALDTIAQKLVRLGYQYQRGINHDVNLKKAKMYYIAAAKRHSSDGYLMLGMMYLNGDGVEQRVDSAYACLMQSAYMRNYRACLQLGKLYLKGTGVKQDFGKAYNLFKVAADNGNIAKAYYQTGYMFYKGLGVEQSYSEAIRYFKKGAAMNESQCIYMLGCCQMTGYGVPQNMDSTKIYFNKAMAHGNTWVESLARNNIIDSVEKHSQMPFASLTDVKKHRMKAGLMPSGGSSFDADSLQGLWQGKMYEYDWSRSIVENEDNMQLDLQKDGESLLGKLYQNGKLLTDFSADKNSEGWLVTSQTPDDSIYKKKYEVRELTFNLTQQGDSSMLSGNIIRWGYKTNEPSRPVYFILDKVTKQSTAQTTTIDTTFIVKKVYPNPFDNNITIDFTVMEDDDIQFRLCTTQGKVEYNSKEEHYQQGAHSITLNPEVSSNIYLLEVRGKEFVWSENVIRH